MDFSNEFIAGTGGLSAMMGTLYYYYRTSERRHNNCEKKIDNLIAKVSHMDKMITKIQTTMEILVFDRTGKKTFD